MSKFDASVTFFARVAEVAKRLGNGGLDVYAVNEALQTIIDGKFPVMTGGMTLPWDSVDIYKNKIRGWNAHFGWQIPDEKIDALELKQHVSDELIEGITLLFDGGLERNLEIVIAVITYELKKLGVEFTHYPDLKYFSWLPGSEPVSDEFILEPAHLSLKIRDTKNGICPNEFCPTKPRWPGIEGYWLMALNPRILIGIDYEKILAILTPGLVVDSYALPVFHRDSDEAYVGGHWRDHRWDGSAALSFRD